MDHYDISRPYLLRFSKGGRKHSVQDSIRPLQYEVPIMQIGLALFIMGFISVVVVSIGANITSIAILIFAINIFTALE
jgi:hypothetical protein